MSEFADIDLSRIFGRIECCRTPSMFGLNCTLHCIWKYFSQNWYNAYRLSLIMANHPKVKSVLKCILACATDMLTQWNTMLNLHGAKPKEKSSYDILIKNPTLLKNSLWENKTDWPPWQTTLLYFGKRGWNVRKTILWRQKHNYYGQRWSRMPTNNNRYYAFNIM